MTDSSGAGKLAHLALPIISGAVAGLLAVVVVSSFRHTAEARPSMLAPAAPSHVASPIISSGSDSQAAEIAQLSARLEAVENRRSSEPLPPAAPPMSPEESARIDAQRHTAVLEAHASEPTDPKWAPHATSALRGHLEDLAPKLKGRLVDLDCRSVTCVGTLEWPSRADAMQSVRTMATTAYRHENCAREFWVTNGGSSDGSARTQVIFNCEDARSGVVPEVLPELPEQ